EPAQGYPGELVSGSYFAMFGIRAYAGRLLAASDDQPGAPPVAVMSYRLWQQTYGSDASVIGSVFNLDDKPFSVVGISTEPFVEADADLNKHDLAWLDLIGRIQTVAVPASIE